MTCDPRPGTFSFGVDGEKVNRESVARVCSLRGESVSLAKGTDARTSAARRAGGAGSRPSRTPFPLIYSSFLLSCSAIPSALPSYLPVRPARPSSHQNLANLHQCCERRKKQQQHKLLSDKLFFARLLLLLLGQLLSTSVHFPCSCLSGESDRIPFSLLDSLTLPIKRERSFCSVLLFLRLSLRPVT